MTAESDTNLTVFRRLVEEGFSAGDPSVADDVITDDFVEHQTGISPANRDGVKAAIAFLHRLAPDFSLTVEALCPGGDLVWGRMTGRGTHTGEGLGEPTGRKWEITVIDVCRFRGGKIVEHWGVPDRFAQMQQLGIMPGAPRSAGRAG